MEKYNETSKWLFSKLPMYQREGSTAYRQGLDAMHKLDKHLKHPHREFKSIHIGGTNGKGSTAHIIASVLQEAGFKTGLYSSPHLLDFRERIKIDGLMIPKQEVVDFIFNNKSFFEKNKFSFFEMTVGMAFWYFSKKKVDYAVIEVGLGGRLDATNIITPELSIITNIGLDHVEFLGDNHAAIAKEKAGIIKNKIPVVIGEKKSSTQKIFQEKAYSCNSSLHFVKKDSNNYFSDLKGSYQIKNIRTASTALNIISNGSFDKSLIQKGLSNVLKNTKLMGRWQIIKDHPKVILDVAHNKEGLIEITKQISIQKYRKLHLVLGFVKGRNVKDLLALFPIKSNFYLSSPNIERAIPLIDLKNKMKGSELNIKIEKSIVTAYKNALSNSNFSDLIIVTGSTFVIAEILKFVKK